MDFKFLVAEATTAAAEGTKAKPTFWESYGMIIIDQSIRIGEFHPSAV